MNEHDNSNVTKSYLHMFPPTMPLAGKPIVVVGIARENRMSNLEKQKLGLKSSIEREVLTY
jgi:hypothetical protein